MADHAILSASAASRWIACPGSVALNIDKPDVPTPAAEEGTLAHSLAAAMLTDQPPTSWPTGNPEIIKHVEKYVEIVRAIVSGVQGSLMVEKRVSMEAYVPGCWGTADAIILTAEEIIVIDLKFGSNPRNLVVAENNPQLRLYGLGAYWSYGEVVGVKRVRMMIIQPRLDSVTEEVLTVEELLSWGDEVKSAAIRALSLLTESQRALTPEWEQIVGGVGLPLGAGIYNPGQKQCQWCRAKLDCPAMIAIVEEETGCQFDNLDEPVTVTFVPDADRLPRAMSAVDLIEDWCREVRAEVERRLMAGQPVEGFKLVEGRKGARAWTDPTAVEQLLKEKFRLTKEEMYDMKLISPTSAEKVLKAQPRRWAQVKELIHQPAGKPSVAPESDKRPALKVADGSEFDNLNEEELA